MSIQYLIEKIERANSIDRELMLSYILDSVAGKLDERMIHDFLLESCKSEIEDSLDEMTDQERLDEFCDTYGFEELVNELRERREEEYNNIEY